MYVAGSVCVVFHLSKFSFYYLFFYVDAGIFANESRINKKNKEEEQEGILYELKCGWMENLLS